MLARDWFGSYLHVKRASQLVAALSLHGFNFCVMESMEGQMLHFAVILVGNRIHRGVSNY